MAYRDLKGLVLVWLEASAYVDPASPGLSLVELEAIARARGHQLGELRDAVDALTGDKIERSLNGRLWLVPSGTASLRGMFLHQFRSDPRRPEAFDFVHGQLVETARTHGMDAAAVRLSELLDAAPDAGLSLHDVRVAVRLLSLDPSRLLLDAATGLVHGGAGWLKGSRPSEHLAEAPRVGADHPAVSELAVVRTAVADRVGSVANKELNVLLKVPRCDVGVLTIKDEEFEAVLDVFSDESELYEGPKSKRHYNLRTADAGKEKTYRIAIVRHVEQGTGDAQTTARDMIEDLDPKLILVVGIAGGRPTVDFTLGDVILSMRVHDYTVRSSSPDKDDAYALAGGPIAGEIQKGVANLRARQADLGDWTGGLPARPPVDPDALRLKGPPDWQNDIRTSIQHHFRESPRSSPLFRAGVIGSSDDLIKDPEILIAWLSTARNLLAVEMEAAGVYRGARDRCAMLAIRGISDIVGLERDERWTKYASCSAAAFARAYLRTTPVAPTSETQTGAAALNPQ
jgi:nucleoside phosphorylase|nr:hypothetical protein [Kofleriaceae bacterium]